MYEVPDQTGRRIVVTGANSGTGKEAAKRLAAAGAHVIMAVRTPRKGEEAKRDILKAVPKASLEVRQLDLASLDSVRAFASKLVDGAEPLDTLLNNAGVMTPPRRETTRDGFELQFGVNFLGPFALTSLLMPALLRARAPRVATMTSSAAMTGKIAFDDLQSERKYSAFAAYAQSKLADLVMADELARIAEVRGWPLLSTSAHPGYTRTNLLMNGPNMGTGKAVKAWYYHLVPSMGVAQGTDPILHAATDPAAKPAMFYGPRWLLIGDAHVARQPGSVSKVDAARLWTTAERLTRTKLRES